MKNAVMKLFLLFTSIALVAGEAQGAEPSAAAAWPQATREMKPWVYNWWMGSAVDEAGLRLQVEELERAGFGGFHVIPIYSVKSNPADRTHLSASWLDAFAAAAALAAEKGLGIDLTTGSGWCFGGPQLASEDGCWRLDVARDEKELRPGSRILWKGPDATGRMRILAARPTGQKVKRSGPGGHGLMMNPLSERAMERFLAPYSSAFKKGAAATPRCMYHDSYEYFGAAWSPDFLQAFRELRGYDLAGRLDAMAGVGDAETVARVKCDYRETVSDLIVARTFPKWTAWCAERGIRTRNEAHGAPANLLDFYAVADIPETEMFSCDKSAAQFPAVTSSFMNSGDRDVLVSKFASSAAHVKHAGADAAPLVAAESGTWICEHFCETPAAVKTFLDRLFLAGVNHVFYHGTCYSPADAKWPGWTFYATCEMNRFNPLWRHADTLNAYAARVQSIAQTSAPDNDLLVYWPLHDFWMDADGFVKQLTVHDRRWLYDQPVGRIAKSLHDAGHSFDFVSERQLFSLADARRTRYAAILVPPAKHMKPETLRRLFALAGMGYKVLFADAIPADVPGLADVERRRAEIRRLASALPANVSVGPFPDVLKSAPLRREPFNRDAGLMHVRHRKGDVTYYFIANQLRDEGVKGTFRPSATTRHAVLMNPLDGRIEPLPVVDGAVALDLPIGHSAILAVSAAPMESAAPQTLPATQTDGAKAPAIPLAGEWTRVAVAGGPEFPPPARGALPMPWGGAAGGPEEAFSGTMRYATVFRLAAAPGAGEAELRLGGVREAARVFVNGREAGSAILPPWTVRFPASLLRAGENEIAVEVTSTGANRLRWLDRTKPYEWKVFTDINMVDVGYRRLDASQWTLHEAGLYGPVSLRVKMDAQ